MIVTDAVVDLLQAAGLGQPGSTIFKFHAPERVKKCLLVLDPLEGFQLDEDLPGYLKGSFQVVVRDTDYQSAMTVAKQVSDALNLHRLNVNGIEIKRMRATHAPIAYRIPTAK